MSVRSLRIRHLVVLTWSLVIAALLLTPTGDDLPSGGAWDWLDKPVHAVLFAVHCGLLVLSLGASTARDRALITAVLVSGLYAVLLEAIQTWVPGRSWEWWDLAAGFAGIAIVALLVARSHARLRGTF